MWRQRCRSYSSPEVEKDSSQAVKSEEKQRVCNASGRDKNMKLVIGGYAQGKLHYVLQNMRLQGEQRNEPGQKKQLETVILDGTLDFSKKTAEKQMAEKQPTGHSLGGSQVIVNHLHRYIREQLQQGKDPEAAILTFLREYPDCIMICDEIGNGIVPIEAEERIYRERTGRILEQLAAQADEVVRVVCGIGLKIK